MTRAKTITHAKMAQSLVHAPLFRSFELGQQKKQKLDVSYAVGEVCFRFWGPEPLGATDLRVLQGVVALATHELPRQGGVESMLRDGRLRSVGLKFDGDVSKEKTIAVRFMITTFAQLIGYVRPGQATLARLRQSIDRLSAVTVLVQRPGIRASYHLLSGYFEDTRTGEVVVGLNPSGTAAVLGKTEFLRVDFEEIRGLKSDAARLIHSRLHWINQGAVRQISLETLCKYVYAETLATPSALSNRKETVRKAIQELRDIGWGVTEIKAGTISVHRPKSTQRYGRTVKGPTVKR